MQSDMALFRQACRPPGTCAQPGKLLPTPCFPHSALHHDASSRRRHCNAGHKHDALQCHGVGSASQQQCPCIAAVLSQLLYFLPVRHVAVVDPQPPSPLHLLPKVLQKGRAKAESSNSIAWQDPEMGLLLQQHRQSATCKAPRSSAPIARRPAGTRPATAPQHHSNPSLWNDSPPLSFWWHNGTPAGDQRRLVPMQSHPPAPWRC